MVLQRWKGKTRCQEHVRTNAKDAGGGEKCDILLESEQESPAGGGGYRITAMSSSSWGQQIGE